MRRLAAFVFVLVLVFVGTRSYRAMQDKPEATVPLPDRTFTMAAFDSIQWADEASEIARGKEVFGWVCAKCHGIAGKGDGGEVLNGDTLHPPSFVAPEWRFANDTQGLWQRIYLGNNRGMPHWGEQGLQPRDVMAVAAYIQKDLRK